MVAEPLLPAFVATLVARFPTSLRIHGTGITAHRSSPWRFAIAEWPFAFSLQLHLLLAGRRSASALASLVLLLVCCCLWSWRLVFLAALGPIRVRILRRHCNAAPPIASLQ